MSSKPLTGYDLFIAQGKALKDKQREPKRAQIPGYANRGKFVENNVLEKKEVLFNKKNSLFGDIHSPITNQKDLYSIKRIVDNRQWTSDEDIQLPPEVMKVIDGKHLTNIMNHYKNIAKEYGVKYLIKLSELSHGVDASGKKISKPSRYFAKACSKENWQKTHQTLCEILTRIEKTKDMLIRAGLNKLHQSKYFYYYYNAIKNLSESEINQCIDRTNSKHTRDRDKRLAFEVSGLLAKRWLRSRLGLYLATTA